MSTSATNGREIDTGLIISFPVPISPPDSLDCRMTDDDANKAKAQAEKDNKDAPAINYVNFTPNDLTEGVLALLQKYQQQIHDFRCWESFECGIPSAKQPATDG
jgi:hypothetical protein